MISTWPASCSARSRSPSSRTAAVLVDKAIGEAGDYDSVSVILQTAVRQAGDHFQLPPRHLRLRPAHRGARLEGHGRRPKTSAPVSIEVANGDGYTRPPLHDFFMTRYTEAYANEIASFIAAIEKGAKITPSGADGLAALALADAARAVRQGRPPGQGRLSSLHSARTLILPKSVANRFAADFSLRASPWS